MAPITPIIASLTPQKQSIAVEQMANYILTLHNQANQEVSLKIYLEGVNVHWVMGLPTRITLKQAESAKIVITITPPFVASASPTSKEGKQAADYQLSFVISLETFGSSWRQILEANLTIKPFNATTSLIETNKKIEPKTRKVKSNQIPLLHSLFFVSSFFFVCIFSTQSAWLPALLLEKGKEGAWTKVNSEADALFEAEFWPKTKVLKPLPKEREPIFMAPNWSAPLSPPTGLPTLTSIPFADGETTIGRKGETANEGESNHSSTLPPSSTLTLTASSTLTLAPSPTIFLAPSSTPTLAPSLTATLLPSATPTFVSSPTPPLANSSTERLFASEPTLLMIEPVKTDLTYEEMFKRIGEQYAINWRLLASLAYQESRLNPLAVGKDGDMGLMQILPTTWDEFAPEVGVSDPFDPYSNVEVGAAYLNYLRGYLVSQGYSEEYWTLVAYNWGLQNMRELMQKGGNWGDIPPLRQNYAYTIIETVNNSSSSWWENKLKEKLSVISE